LSRRSHSSQFDHLNYIGWGVQIIKHVIISFSPILCYLVPLRPKYSPQHSTINATKIHLGKDSRSVSISYTNVAKFSYLEWQ
jgi:hypothetical protein